MSLWTEHFTAFKSFIFLFGVNHLVLNEAKAWFVMKALIYGFLYLGLKVGDKGDIWGATELLRLVA